MDMHFICQECGQVLEIRWKLENHMKFQHDTKTNKCIKCGEEMIDKGKYDNHLKKHKTTTCGACWLLVPTNSWSSHKLKCTRNLLKNAHIQPLPLQLPSDYKETLFKKIKDCFNTLYDNFHLNMTLKIH